MRQAVQAYLQSQSIAHLNSIFRAQPTVIDGASFFTGAGGDQFGAVAYPYVVGSHESYEALQRRKITYTIDLIVAYRSTLAEPGTGDVDAAETAMQNLDDIVDAIKASLRTSTGRTLGGVVFSAGEGAEQHQPDLEVFPWGMPVKNEDDTQIEQWLSIRFLVVESIVAPVS